MNRNGKKNSETSWKLETSQAVFFRREFQQEKKKRQKEKKRKEKPK